MPKPLATILRVMATGFAFLLFWWGGLVISWVVLPVVGLRHRDPIVRARRCRQVISGAFRLHFTWARWCGLVSFDPDDLRGRLPSGPYVLVANHPTLIDVVLLLGSAPNAFCVVSTRLFTSPFVGRLLRACAHLDAGGGGAAEGMAVIGAAVERLRQGDPVLVFPEGTRSPARALGRFKTGAFMMARTAGVPVVPVHIDCTPPGLMKGMPWYTVPDGALCYSMTVLPAVTAAAYGDDVRRFAAAVQAELQVRVEQHGSQVDATGAGSLALTG